MVSESSQKGKAIESLIAATCILGAKGEFSVSTPFVDDDGIDLIFSPKRRGRSIFVQVKSRFTLKGGYRAQIRKKTFVPREDFYIIFAYYDENKAQLGDTVWFVPSIALKENLKGQNPERTHYIFQSRFLAERDMWKPYRYNLKDLPQRILELSRCEAKD